MIVYAIAAALSVLLAIALNVRTSDEINLKRLAVYMPLIPYLAVAILRSGVGKDTAGEWSTYPRVYKLVETGYSYRGVYDIVPIEPLYYWLNRAAVALAADIAFIYATMSAVFLIFMYRFILDKSANIPLSLLLLFASDLFMFSLSGIRQAAACGIAFFALKYAHQRRPWAYFLWIAVAAGFHFTALIFALFYFVNRRRLTVIGAAVLTIMIATLYLTPGLVRRFGAIYYGAFYFGSKWDYSNFNLIPALSAGIMMATALIRSKQILERDRSMQIYTNVMVANFVLMAISPLLITPIRLYFLLIPAAFALAPAIVASIPRKHGAIRLFTATGLVGVTSLQLVYELSIGNDAYSTWNYEWIFGAA